MSDPESCPRPILRDDAEALIGVLAKLTGLIWVGRVDADSVEAFRKRGVKDGYLRDDAGKYELLQAFSDLVERLRFTLGEYEAMPPPVPLPRDENPAT